MTRGTLGVFAKWPEPGAVKTRLGGSPAWGVRVARAMLLDTLQKATGFQGRRILAFTPSSAFDDFAALLPPGFELVLQGEGDLGARMERFFCNHLRTPDDAVILIGADSPTLPLAYVIEGFARLEQANVVVGPAVDGGYYLIGCRGATPPIFEGIAWGGAEVLASTIARLSDPQWRLSVLPPWYDVDAAADWALLRGHLAALRRAQVDPGAPHTEALMTELTS
jgi:rSAM/selenodomain-associated transferase 1